MRCRVCPRVLARQHHGRLEDDRVAGRLYLQFGFFQKTKFPACLCWNRYASLRIHTNDGFQPLILLTRDCKHIIACFPTNRQFVDS